MEIEYSKQDIQNIAKYQRLICWLVLIGMSLMLVSILLNVQAHPLTAGIFGAGRLIIGILILFFYYLLGKSLKMKRLFLYVLGIFIPLVNLLVILTFITRATKVLRAQKIKVGIMGASPKDVVAFLTQTA